MMTFIRTWLHFPIESLPIAEAQSVPGRLAWVAWHARGRRGAPRAQPGTGSGRQWYSKRVTRRVSHESVYLKI